MTVLLSDIRGYSTIAEDADPTRLAAQLSEHRAEMCTPILAADGTVMAFAGDAVMAVFGAPFPSPTTPPGRWRRRRPCTPSRTSSTGAGGRPAAVPLGIGLSTGEVAAALLGSEERLEYL